MPDKFLTTVIADLAKLRLRMDDAPNHILEGVMRDEYEAKREHVKSSVPVKYRGEVDRMIEDEISHYQVENIFADIML